MANSKVPQFGSWGAEENVGYTAYFETARKGKSGGPIINPNDPQMNSDVQPQARPPPPRPQPAKPEPKQPKFGEWEAEEEVPYTVYFENTRKGKGNPNEPQMNRDQVRPQPKKPEPKKPELKQPKFGEWEEEEVPYTAYFENPGKDKRNPNDPQMNRDVQYSAQPPATPPQPTEPKQPKFGEWEAAEEVPYTAYFENPGKAKRNPSDPQMNRDVGPSVATKPNPPVANPNVRSGDNQGRQNVVKFTGGVRNVEQSPIHPRGAGTQPSSFESAQGTPGRAGSKTPVRGAQNPARGGASIPAFGDWNKNPDQAEGYTVVFGELQKDRREGAAGATPPRPDARTPTHGYGAQQQPKDDCFSRFFSCFSSSR